MGVPVCVVSTTGIAAPSYADILTYLQQQYQAIYGQDTYLGNDSQDGQFLGILAAALADTNAMAVAVFNSFSPATAQGTGLSSQVKINGIARLVPSSSTVPITIGGTVNTPISRGAVSDANGAVWNLPPSVVIPSAGTIVVTGTAASPGATVAAPGSATISTPTLGWQTAVIGSPTAVGQPTESDAALRQRQSVSTAQPAQTVSVAVLGAVLALPGVTRAALFENDTSLTNGNGIPPHSFSVVVEGGSLQNISDTILLRKGPGAGTYGTTTEVSVDGDGVPHNINFFVVSDQTINVVVTLAPLVGYTSLVGQQIAAAVTAYINSLPIGQSVLYTRLYAVATLPGAAGLTYDLTSIVVGIGGATPAAANAVLSFNQAAQAGSVTVVA